LFVCVNIKTMGNAVCRKKPKDGKINFTPIPGTDLGETPN